MSRADRLPSDWDAHKAVAITDSREIRDLYDQTQPIAGRPGWRIDEAGREWYSASWLNGRPA